MTSPERVLIQLKIFGGPFSFDRNVMRSCCALKCHTRPCFEWSTYSWVPMYVGLNQITQIAGLKKNCSVSRQYTRQCQNYKSDWLLTERHLFLPSLLLLPAQVCQQAVIFNKAAVHSEMDATYCNFWISPIFILNLFFIYSCYKKIYLVDQVMWRIRIIML